MYDTTRVGIGTGKTALMASGSWGNSDQHSALVLQVMLFLGHDINFIKVLYDFKKIDVDSTTLNLRLKSFMKKICFIL